MALTNDFQLKLNDIAGYNENLPGECDVGCLCGIDESDIETQSVPTATATSSSS